MINPISKVFGEKGKIVFYFGDFILYIYIKNTIMKYKFHGISFVHIMLDYIKQLQTQKTLNMLKSIAY